MNDVDQDVSSTLHRLIDREPVDTERAPGRTQVIG